MLQLTFLGTSAGIPTKQRNVTGLAVECINPYLTGSQTQSKKNRPWILIDCGEATQHQLLHCKLSLHQLAVICITHVHGDHCYGLPGLLASAAMSGRTKPLTIIAPQAISQFLDSVKATTDLYLPYCLNFVATEDVLTQASNPQSDHLTHSQHIRFNASHYVDIDITALSHRVPSHAFGLTQTMVNQQLDTAKLIAAGIAAGPIWGQLQQGQDVVTESGATLLAADYVKQTCQTVRVVIAGDNDAPDLLAAAVQDAQLLVHEATYTQDVLDKIQAKPNGIDPQHSTVKQVASFATKQQIPNLVLTHFSARYQLFETADSQTANMGHIRVEANLYYQGNLWLATDFAQYQIIPDTVVCINNETEAASD